MLKFLFMLLFIMPLCLMKKSYWLVQNMIFMMGFIFMMMGIYNYYFINMSYNFGCDVISYGLILLSIWICGLMIMASEMVNRLNNYYNFFNFIIVILLLMLILTFSTMNIFMFYLFFESSLVPTLFLILGWGYQPERLQASLYLLFYTLFASLPLLIGIIYLFNNFNTLEFMLLLLNKNMYWIMYMSMIFAFLVKMPMFLVHLWLPKAHVEAPIAGSMILAGILLKLGGYGLIRMMPMIQKLGQNLNFIWVSISLVGGVIVSLVCLWQMDLKSLIAYSSVAHMGVVLSGLMTMTLWGLSGSYTLMLAHGLCSSGLFCLANISYERMNSRSLLINKGMLNFMPSMAMWWFLLSSSNMAAPPTLNLLGEMSLLNSIISWSWMTMLSLSLLSFFSAVYTLYLYSYSQHGKMFMSYSIMNSSIREFLLLMLHWLPLNLLILKSDLCMLWL